MIRSLCPGQPDVPGEKSTLRKDVELNYADTMDNSKKNGNREYPVNDSSPNDEAIDEQELDEEELDEEADETGDYDDDEFSLEQLSEAYAKVIGERGGNVAEVEPEFSEGFAFSSGKENKPGVSEQAENEKADEDESDDDVACPVSPESILESILFVGAPKDVKLTSRNIASLMRDVSAKEVTALSKKLNAKYEAESSAYRVSSSQGTMRMELHPDLVQVQNYMLGRYRAVRLSQQAIDVLAIVAYNQPVTRQQVDEIRAKSSGGIIRQMVRRGLVQAEADGKQEQFRTTDRFLNLFGLDGIEDLPQSHDSSGMDELAD